MSIEDRERLRSVRTFPSLVKYLSEELEWPIETEDFDDLTFDYEPQELGLDIKTAVKIQEIKQLRPLVTNQPWGIFFIKFEPKRLPVVALRRILSKLVVKKRASASRSEQATWHVSDLLFISAYGEGDHRQINIAHFAEGPYEGALPTLKVLGWDEADRDLKIDHVYQEMRYKLRWPDDTTCIKEWKETWSEAFILRPREVIRTSKQLAEQLAKLAKVIRCRVNEVLSVESENGPLHRLFKAFHEAFIHDLTEDGFADTYAQTIAYGLLSEKFMFKDKERSSLDVGSLQVMNPFLAELLDQCRKVGRTHGLVDFDELGVGEVEDLLNDPNTKYEDILRDFDKLNPQEDPVIHFYEHFLREYDAKKRIKRGIFYTPKPVVSFIVRSVDEILRTEFNLPDGLADTTTWGEMAEHYQGLKIPNGVRPGAPFVQILDPATGTGTFLVEVIDLIYKTMAEKWEGEGHDWKRIEKLWNDYVPKHLLPRLYGYELLMAPYSIAHMKIGLKLYETGYRFRSDARARIYLTNALEPPSDIQPELAVISPALAHEADAVNDIKSKQRFTVVIGNPPYAGISSNMTEYAQRLVDSYKFVNGKALKERKLWLQDDYVKFIRIAQMMQEQVGMGVFGYITNHGYLDNPTFRGMRQSLMNTFHRLRVLDLHGNANKKERAPDGSEDKNVFDIRQGVAICLATCEKNNPQNEPLMIHTDLWGNRGIKYAWLASHTVSSTKFNTLTPDSPFYFFHSQNTDCRAEYERGWRINDLMPLYSAGFITARDHFVIDFDHETLIRRIADFANAKWSDAEIRAKYFAGCGSDKYPDGDTRGWKVPEARRLVQGDKDWQERDRTSFYRPFDQRFVYWAGWMVDWPRPEVMGHMIAGPNLGLHVCRQSVSNDWRHVLVTRGLTDDCYVSNKTRERGYLIPLHIYPSHKGLVFDRERKPNFHPRFLKMLAASLGLPQTEAHELPQSLTPEDIFHYVYAVFHSPGYRNRYAEFLKIDFPRLPLTSSLELFRALAGLGGELVVLHLMESPKLDDHVTTPVGSGEFKVEKVSYSDRTVWIDKARTRGFQGVPEEVWNFHIGGYQVFEKWLKDRQAKGGKKPRPGRVLTDDDIAHYQKIVVALNETIRIMKEIDEVIDQHGGWPDAFVQS